ncbi:MAG: hypothetical protein IPM39_23150 [Chloroflexi bacterium]|nr:hypothetical protein [Chloroflexota bacterium]
MMKHLYLKRKRMVLPALYRLVIPLLTLAVLAMGAPGQLVVQPVWAQSGNGITQPVSGETIAGVVRVMGTAVHPDYLRYEMAFRHVSDPTADWIVFAEGSLPVNQGTLAVWDTTIGRDVGAPVFPDGRYQLRLRVVRADYNYDEYFVTDLVVANADVTPTATPTATTDGAAPALATTPTAGETAVFQQPTALPSLTPFPTPTPPAAPANPGSGAVSAPQDAAVTGGVFDQLAGIDGGRFGRAFWQGARFTALIFGGLALYLLLRAFFRWLWRSYWQRPQKRD